MKVFENLVSMKCCLSDGACAPILEVLEELEDDIEGPIDKASFADLFGAPVYLVECVEDLAQVCSHEERLGLRLSLLEAASPWFDIAEWIDGKGYARFVTIEYAAGGPQYLVPKGIADQARSVAESIALVSARKT